MEIDKKIDSSQYGDGVKLQDYKGTFFVIATKYNSEGEVFMQWAFPQVNRKPTEKAIPFKVSLGTKKEAIETLELFVATLKRLGTDKEQRTETQEAVDTVQELFNASEVPF